jgi:hypothetical protein
MEFERDLYKKQGGIKGPITNIASLSPRFETKTDFSERKYEIKKL